MRAPLTAQRPALAVVCTIADDSALRLAHALTARGTPCAVVTREALSFARRRSQRLCDGGVSGEIVLADGTRVDSGALRGVVNRTYAAPDVAWARAAPAERDYASAELYAFTMSWLAGLPCPVRNRPTVTSLAGPAPHPAYAAAAAAAAGLLVAPLHLGPAADPTGDAAIAATLPPVAAARAFAGPGAVPVHVVCLDGEPTTAVPGQVAAGLAAFARRIGATEALIGVDFLVGAGGWWFAGITAVPDLTAAGPTLVPRLLAVFAAGAPR